MSEQESDLTRKQVIMIACGVAGVFTLIILGLLQLTRDNADYWFNYNIAVQADGIADWEGRTNKTFSGSMQMCRDKPQYPLLPYPTVEECIKIR